MVQIWGKAGGKLIVINFLKITFNLDPQKPGGYIWCQVECGWTLRTPLQCLLGMLLI